MYSTTNNAENGHSENSSTEIVERVKIPWTPFYVVGTPEKGYFVSFGKYRLTDSKPTKVEAVNDLEKERWTITAKVAGLVQEMMIEEEIRKIKEYAEKHPHDAMKPNENLREAKTYKEQQDEEQMQKMREMELQKMREMESKPPLLDE